MAKSRRIRSVAILGGGPSGATLGAKLVRAGIDVTLFFRRKRPPIIVGESMVPAIVPFLRELEIEEEVASYSIRKDGATFVFDRDSRFNVRFDEVRNATTTYSYNAPRDKFDETVLRAAEKFGVKLVETSAQVERDGDSDRVLLSQKTLAAAGMTEQPDLVIDAGGRARTLIRLFDIPFLDGDRRDTALHAHYEGIEVEIEGNVHTDRLGNGWCWRIPLPGRVSMGVVCDGETLKKFGDEPTEQIDNFFAQDPVIRDYMKAATRVTPVVKYSNYQSRSTRMVGENWALVGDAAGFIDPVFSSGLAVAFQSADYLAEAIIDGRKRALARYDKKLSRLLGIWHNVIRHFYNGRLLTLFRVGQVVRDTFPGRLVDWHFRTHMPKIFTGEDVGNWYSYRLVQFMTQHALAGNDPEELRIR